MPVKAAAYGTGGGSLTSEGWVGRYHGGLLKAAGLGVDAECPVDSKLFAVPSRTFPNLTRPATQSFRNSPLGASRIQIKSDAGFLEFLSDQVHGPASEHVKKLMAFSRISRGLTVGRAPNSIACMVLCTSEPRGSYGLNTRIASSPRLLMTLTAMRPVVGLGKGREMSRFRVAHASASTSALSVVLSDL